LAVTGYSGRQILLHWSVAVLIAAQFLLAEGMEEAWRAVRDGGAKVMTTGAAIHIAIGLAVLALGIWRLAIRLRRGAPAAPAGTSGLQETVARITHVLLYVLMIGLPVGGLLAWALESETFAEAHVLGKSVLMILVILHILGAVYNQWVLKNGLIRRMMKAEG
jgi:cytochrome b561